MHKACNGCICRAGSEEKSTVDHSSVEIVDQLWYLGDILFVDEDADAVVTATIHRITQNYPVINNYYSIAKSNFFNIQSTPSFK